MIKLYGDRDIRKQKDYYLRHISAMTTEGLHEKSDIAAELAHRDYVIDNLRLGLELLCGSKCNAENNPCHARYYLNKADMVFGNEEYDCEWDK